MSVGGSDLMEDKDASGEMLDKEDMTDMFSRAMLEKMQPEGRLSVGFTTEKEYNM